MIVAVTAWEDRVSPVFDSAKILLIANIQGRKVVGRSYEKINARYVEQAAQLFQEKEITKVICGAVSQESTLVIENYGIELIPFITGEIEAILERFAKGQKLEKFTMPGCIKCPYQRNVSDWRLS